MTGACRRPCAHRLPAVKQLRDFDFTAVTAPREIESLHGTRLPAPGECDLLGINRRRHDAPGDQLRHCRSASGRRVYHGTLADLITSLEEAQAAGRLQPRLTSAHAPPALLVVDEIGTSLSAAPACSSSS